MRKRERLERAITGVPVDRLLVSLRDFRDDRSEFLQLKLAFPGEIRGGLSGWEHLRKGRSAPFQPVIRDVWHHTEGRRLILAVSRDGYVAAPLSNLRAVRASVENLAA